MWILSSKLMIRLVALLVQLWPHADACISSRSGTTTTSTSTSASISSISSISSTSSTSSTSSLATWELGLGNNDQKPWLSQNEPIWMANTQYGESTNMLCGRTVGFNPYFDPFELNHASSHRRAGRIVGGNQVAVDNAWPWMVAIYNAKEGTPRFRCSGTLINQNFILTVASCVHGMKASQTLVSLGTNKLATDNLELQPIEAIKIHEEFSIQFRENDIALLKLKNTVSASTSLNAICLPKSRNADVVFNKNLLVVGWGSKDGTISITTTLNQQILTVQGKGKPCYDDSKYCASRRANKNSNICWYDLGSPLMFYDKKKWFIYGIASVFAVDSFARCDTSRPSLYTRVPNYLNWINYHVNILMPKRYRETKSSNYIDN